MMYLGDFPADQAIYFMWNTNDGDGASITRATDGTISVYKDASNGTAFDTTQVTTGVTNDEDFDTLTGVHSCCITTTDAWYETGHDYTVVLSAATIDGSTVNAVLTHFSIENRNMRGTDSAAPSSTALSTATWTAARAAVLSDWINGGRLDNLLDAIPTTAMRGTDNAAPSSTALSTATWTAARAAVLSDWINGGRLDNLLDAIPTTAMRGTDGANTTVPDAAGVAPTAAENADAVWDEILTGATHNIPTSAGRRVREIGAYAINSGTAQAGNGYSITLAATASAIDGTYDRNLLVITGNTGIGQTRTIVDYNGTSKVALVDRAWKTSPDVTSEYQVTAFDTSLVVDLGQAQAGSANTITLRSIASAIDNTYNSAVVAIAAGTGVGQSRLITGYVGATKVATLADNWVTNPDATSVYIVMPYGASCVGHIHDAALAQINSECDAALEDINLDHLISAAVDTDWGTTVNLDSVLGHMSDVGTAATFDRLTDSLEAIRNQGDSAWITGGAGAAPTVGQIRAEMEGAGYFLDLIKDDTNELQTDWHNGGRLDNLLDAIPTTVMRGTDNAATPANVATALSNINLDHLIKIAVDTDWGTTVNLDSVLGHMADVGTAATFNRVTDALEAIRNRGDAAWSAAAGTPSVLIDTAVAVLTDQTHFTLVNGSDIDDAYLDQAVVIYDASNSDFPSVRKVAAYTGATKTVALDSAPDFTAISGDGIKVFVTAPGTTAPTSAQNADAVWDEAKADHTDPTTFGVQNTFVNG